MSASATVRRAPVPGTFALVAMLTCLYVLVRLVGITTSVTVDEPVFVGISANFLVALSRGEFASTAQFLYPAVPIMWAGTLGFLIDLPHYANDYGQYIPPDFQANAGPIRSVGGDPLSVLHTARTMMVLAEGILFSIALIVMRRLFGTPVAATAALLIAFDPFLVSHDQILHVDGVTGIAAFTCMLLIAHADQRPERTRPWILAGVVAAICWLTRLTGMVLIPIAALVILNRAFRSWRTDARNAGEAVRWFTSRFGSFLGAGILATIGMWPALWVAPRATISFVADSWNAAMGTPHEWGLYFMGKPVSDPGLLFYPLVMLFKLTPFTLLGLAIFAAIAGFRIGSMIPNQQWRPIILLGLFVAVYTTGMMLGARKFDRYILPDFLFLDLFAAIAIVGVVSRAWHQRLRSWRYAGAGLASLLLLGQATSSMALGSYPLLYYNPLMGGLKSAEYVLMPGWGEGLDEAAAWIVQQPHEAPLTVRSSISPPLLTYYVPSDVRTGGLGVAANPMGIWQWANTDYGITTILQWNRGAYQGSTDAFAGGKPVHVVTVGGRDVVRVYDLATIPPPDALFAGNPCVWTFEGDIAFVGYGAHPARPQESSAIELVFQTRDAARSRIGYVVQGILHSRDGTRADIPFTTTFAANPTNGLLATAEAPVVLPPDTTLDQYWPEIHLFGVGEDAPLPLASPGSGQDGTRAGRATC